MGGWHVYSSMTKLGTRSAIIVCAVLVICAVAFSVVGQTRRISVTSTGGEVSLPSRNGVISGDGRYVSFHTNAALVPEDTNNWTDIYLYDMQAQQIAWVSVPASGPPSGGGSFYASVNETGRFVGFTSLATDLIAGDTNGREDSYVKDRQTGEVFRVSVASDGTQGNGESATPYLSADGRYAAFVSKASNLVPNDTNGRNDVFLHDRQTGETKRISVSSTGAQGTGGSGVGGNATYVPISISADGRYVVFNSDFTNLVSNDTNANRDVFVHDRDTGETKRVSVSSTGAQGDLHSFEPNLSADGRFVVFSSVATNLVPNDTNGNRADVFRHDLQTGATTLVSLTPLGLQVNRECRQPVVSRDGRFVAFESSSPDFVVGDTNSAGDCFVRDLLTGNVVRASISSTGGQAFLGGIDHFDMSSDGRSVVFSTASSNMVPGDTNMETDMFVREIGPANELVGLSLSASIIAGQNRAVGTVQMGFPAALRADVIRLNSNSGSVSVPSQIAVDTGATSKSFAIMVMPVTASTVGTITATYGFQTETANLTLNPLIPSSMKFTPSPTAGGTTVSCRLVLNGVAPTGGKVVTISSTGASCSPPSSVTVPAGASQVTFDIPTSAVSSIEYVTVTASVSEGSKTGLLVLRP